VRGIAPGVYKIFAFQTIAGGEFYNSRFLSKYEFRGRSLTVSQRQYHNRNSHRY
jgi:hypothetical protein